MYREEQPCRDGFFVNLLQLRLQVALPAVWRHYGEICGFGEQEASEQSMS
jgi:hypothetical protein